MTDRIKEREDRWRAEAANDLITSIGSLLYLESTVPQLINAPDETRIDWAQSWLMAYTKRARAIVKLEGLFRP